MLFYAVLIEGLRDVTIIDVVENDFSSKFYKKLGLSKYMVPYLYSSDLDRAAEDFLERNYPDALEKPMPIDVNELIDNMCLKLYQAPLPNHIFGQSYFDDATVSVYDDDMNGTHEEKIGYGTILVNPYVFFMRNVGCINTTIVHECVHHDRHSLFFELQKILNSDVSYLSCEVVETYGEKGKDVDDALSWMEWQANALTPRIQMPTRTAKPKFEEILTKLHAEYPDEREAVRMQKAIGEIADFYHVSKLLAKIRVIDMGYPAEGTFVYIGGRYCQPYMYRRGALAKNETYLLDEKNAIYLSYVDPWLSTKVREGLFIYAGFAMCINNPKYIKYTEDGVPILTDYALDHMSECCLKFKRRNRVSELYDDSYYKRCFLCRAVEAASFVEADFDSEDIDNQDEESRAREMKLVSEEAKTLERIFAELPGNFSRTLIYHMDRKGVSLEKLAEKSLVSERSITTYRTDLTAKPERNTVLALCIGLKLHPSLTMDMLDKAGYNLFKTYSEDMGYIQQLVFNHHMEDIHRWNEKLIAWGAKTRIPTASAVNKIAS